MLLQEAETYPSRQLGDQSTNKARSSEAEPAQIFWTRRRRERGVSGICSQGSGGRGEGQLEALRGEANKLLLSQLEVLRPRRALFDVVCFICAHPSPRAMTWRQLHGLTCPTFLLGVVCGGRTVNCYFTIAASLSVFLCYFFSFSTSSLVP